jgi:predicted  nucleic acid-binding Zn-ribbon protein
LNLPAFPLQRDEECASEAFSQRGKALKDKIKVLIELQQADNRIQDLLNRRKQGPLKIKALADEMEAVSTGFREDEERLDTVKKDRRSLETEIEDLDQGIRKSNDKLSNIKSNKEYGAALKEIEDLKKKKGRIEDELLQQMEELEQVTERCKTNQDKLRELKKTFERDKKTVQEELGKLDKELKKLEKMRAAIAEKAEPDLLRRYQLVRERIGSSAISPVVGGVCQSCHMGIPPQMFNELMKCIELTSCPHCNRIIYWGEDAHFQDLTNP